MSEENKRFPWWWLACAVVLVLLAVALGFVEATGPQGTIVRRYELVKEGMSQPEVRAVIGRSPHTTVEHGGVPTQSLSEYEADPYGDHAPAIWRRYEWEDGPLEVKVWFENRRLPDGSLHWGVTGKRFKVNYRDFAWADAPWHLRHLAEQAYTAIHGPRR